MLNFENSSYRQLLTLARLAASKEDYDLLSECFIRLFSLNYYLTPGLVNPATKKPDYKHNYHSIFANFRDYLDGLSDDDKISMYKHVCRSLSPLSLFPQPIAFNKDALNTAVIKIFSSLDKYINIDKDLGFTSLGLTNLNEQLFDNPKPIIDAFSANLLKFHSSNNTSGFFDFLFMQDDDLFLYAIKKIINSPQKNILFNAANSLGLYNFSHGKIITEKKKELFASVVSISMLYDISKNNCPDKEDPSGLLLPLALIYPSKEILNLFAELPVVNKINIGNNGLIAYLRFISSKKGANISTANKKIISYLSNDSRPIYPQLTALLPSNHENNGFLYYILNNYFVSPKEKIDFIGFYLNTNDPASLIAGQNFTTHEKNSHFSAATTILFELLSTEKNKNFFKTIFTLGFNLIKANKEFRHKLISCYLDKFINEITDPEADVMMQLIEPSLKKEDIDFIKREFSLIYDSMKIDNSLLKNKINSSSKKTKI